GGASCSAARVAALVLALLLGAGAGRVEAQARGDLPAAAREGSLPGQDSPTPPPDRPVPAVLDGAPYETIRGRRATVYFVPGQAALAERVRTLLDAQPPLPALPPELPNGVHAVLAHTPAA